MLPATTRFPISAAPCARREGGSLVVPFFTFPLIFICGSSSQYLFPLNLLVESSACIWGGSLSSVLLRDHINAGGVPVVVFFCLRALNVVNGFQGSPLVLPLGLPSPPPQTARGRRKCIPGTRFSFPLMLSSWL